MLVVEWQGPAKKCVQNDAARPNINFRSSVKLSGNDFWRGVVGGAAARAKELTVLHHIGQTCKFGMKK